MDRAELDRALEKINIESYLDREGVSYQHSYGTRGLQLNLDECPACGEGGRKTYVNADTGLGKCFHGACNFGFNKFKLIQKVSGLHGEALDEHIRAVARDSGWLPKPKRPELVRGDLELPSKIEWMPHEGRNLRYLENRGIDAATAEHFRLGYCNKGWWGYKLADGTEKWVSYDKRVIIPICDLDGTLVSFQGRDVTGKQEPKYLFPVGFAVAGSHLYNGQNFVEGVHRHAVIGEGAFDAIAVHQALQGGAGLEHYLALATFGMHLSGGPDGQIAKLALLRERGLTHVTFMWDAERKAMAYAVKMGLQLLGVGLKVFIAQLPPGRDPNEVPAEVVRKALFSATALNRLSAIRLLHSAGALAAAGAA